MPDKKYNVIAIDPPWPITQWAAPSQKLHRHIPYSTMTVEAISSLDLPVSSECHVFLWTTQRMLKEALGVLDAWELEYALTFVWHKTYGIRPIGKPEYNCEFALYGRKGKPRFKTNDFSVCFSGPNVGHSVKPEGFYQMVRRVTEGPRLDMFNRRRIEGFEGWGDESPTTQPELDQTYQMAMI